MTTKTLLPIAALTLLWANSVVAQMPEQEESSDKMTARQWAMVTLVTGGFGFGLGWSICEWDKEEPLPGQEPEDCMIPAMEIGALGIGVGVVIGLIEWLEIDEEDIEELIPAGPPGRLEIGPGPWQSVEIGWRVPLPSGKERE